MWEVEQLKIQKKKKKKKKKKKIVGENKNSKF